MIVSLNHKDDDQNHDCKQNQNHQDYDRQQNQMAKDNGVQNSFPFTKWKILIQNLNCQYL